MQNVVRFEAVEVQMAAISGSQTLSRWIHRNDKKDIQFEYRNIYILLFLYNQITRYLLLRQDGAIESG
jgi:hypothetical protein